MLAAAAAYDLDDPALRTSFAGIDLASPIGLAAIFGASRSGSIPSSPHCCGSSTRRRVRLTRARTRGRWEPEQVRASCKVTEPPFCDGQHLLRAVDGITSCAMSRLA